MWTATGIMIIVGCTLSGKQLLRLYSGQERLFLKEKVAGNFPKWGEDGERTTKVRKGGCGFSP
jgi:hypothetical protein